MTRIAIATDEVGWHTRQLQAALRERGAVGRCVDLEDCRIDTAASWHGLVIPGFGSELPDAVLVRGIAGGTFEQVTKRLGVLHALRELGVPVYNDARAIERSVDKSMTSLLLHAAGVATPPTWAMESAAQAQRLVMRESAAGLALQSTRKLADQQITIGASHDRSRSNFEQSEAEGALDATRAVLPAGPLQVDALIHGRSRTTSVYAHDLVSLAPNLQLTLAGRYNDTRVSTVDDGRVQLGLPTTLDGEGRYRKFNPALGLTWQASPAVTWFGSLSQGNRAPSPIELGCSDPANACVLPNALQSDPPLEQVVSRTLEVGARGKLASALNWNAALFHTVNRDDLLFISNGLAAGYFTNFGRTQRQGVELGLSQQTAGFGWSAGYSYLRATYRSSACIVSEHNSTAETSPNCSGEGEIEVRPGDRIPGLPQHSFKLAADWQALAALSLGAQLRAYSGQFVRGNENNQHQPDGAGFNGAGRIGGFAVLDLTGSWKFGKDVELFGKLANVFDRRYATAGLLGANAFDAGGALQAPADWRAEQFLGPGAPRAAWVGVRMSF